MSGYYSLNISELAESRQNQKKQPFPHQVESFAALSKTLTLPIKGYKGTLLVLPTGGGKTYTSISWIVRNIISKGIKVLWLAQSSYLLDQAAQGFIEEIHQTMGRETINLRVVSSSKEHANSGTISPTDDILICTTQTAVGAFSAEQLDGTGEIVRTPFWRFVDSNKSHELFIVVDEAHHTPAYGCRTLLLSIRDLIPNLYILGLTATPMHMDQRISGWLKHIFDQWICYSADKSDLQANKILSVPKYIEKETGLEFHVDDRLYERLVMKHKDLPEEIIENLAGNARRNNLIVSDYVENKEEYGKTLIFADRWFQCEYIVEKLEKQGIRAGALYSVISVMDAVYNFGRGRRNDEWNREILNRFKDSSRKDRLDVLVNVKMMTEGVDVPDVKTVMVTRQTTSNILLTQMIGRALRGEKAGGGKKKETANIVFFHDSWKRLLPWAEVDGELGIARPVVQRRNPYALISVNLVKLAAEDISFETFQNVPFLTYIPVGFLGCEFTVAVEDEGVEELITMAENTVVYEFNKSKYDALIQFLGKTDLAAYADENVSELVLHAKAVELADRFFELDQDNFDGMLFSNISAVLQHMAQNGHMPQFIDFYERDLYDMDKLVHQLIRCNVPDIIRELSILYNNEGLLWGFFYKTFDLFLDAYFKTLRRLMMDDPPTSEKTRTHDSPPDDITPEIKSQVLKRDQSTCLWCGKGQRKGVSLQIDHIQPVAMGGSNEISNLQTLCKECNRIKKTHQINFRNTKTPLRKPKSQIQFYMDVPSDSIENVVRRIINEFYHCQALCEMKWHERRNGKHYAHWEIVLYSGNDPSWLIPHEKELKNFLVQEMGYDHLKTLKIRN